MRLTFLGTGTSTGVPTLGCHCQTCSSSDPHDQRTRSSVLIEYEGRAVVIDTTPDFRQQALREKLDHLDAVVFTHTHADHVFGLDDIRVYNLRQKHAIPVYADNSSMQDIRRIFDYVFRRNYAAGGLPNFDPHLIDGPFELWGQTMVPLHVFHGELPILGFRFGSVAYVTDFSAIPETTLELLTDLDVLVLAALRHKPHPAHSTLKNSVDLVKRLKPQRAFFTHIAHELGHEATNALLPPNIRLAHDGLKLDL
ncbi:MAG TPA: MBL fold metallo-hydrolase [Terriglobia bacterium]|nr:MBL fold metallo-hydrolase [Terriglobia bacterium]